MRAVFERLFRKHGLPIAIQCDNGTPFVATNSRGGLTTLSAWWVSLGIRIVRSRPGCPQDNGGHERMHRDVSADVRRLRRPAERSNSATAIDDARSSIAFGRTSR
ncbi:MAG: DDE-type integrase/transposase/recombinase [Myxococcales bacterium]|nr:DDE-type integrase/transposase/recombinase [Myxococcales bacterium]